MHRSQSLATGSRTLTQPCPGECCPGTFESKASGSVMSKRKEVEEKVQGQRCLSEIMSFSLWITWSIYATGLRVFRLKEESSVLLFPEGDWGEASQTCRERRAETSIPWSMLPPRRRQRHRGSLSRYSVSFHPPRGIPGGRWGDRDCWGRRRPITNCWGRPGAESFRALLEAVERRESAVAPGEVS